MMHVMRWTKPDIYNWTRYCASYTRALYQAMVKIMDYIFITPAGGLFLALKDNLNRIDSNYELRTPNFGF